MGSIANHNMVAYQEPVDTVIVFTHGLTMRLILMQLFRWSPNTFHTIWNADNCDVYVLKKGLSLRRTYPYRLDPEGDMPKSTAHLVARLVGGEQRALRLNDYLSLEQPR